MSYDKKITDLMLPLQNFQSVSADTTVRSLISLFISNEDTLNQNVILVYDNDYLVGYVDLTCFLKPIEPKKLEGFSARGRNIDNHWSIPVIWEGLFYDRCQQMTSLSAKNLMKPLNINIDINDSLVKATHMMTTESLRVLPVSDQHNIVGLLNECLIVTEIMKIVQPVNAQIIDINNILSKNKAIKMMLV